MMFKHQTSCFLAWAMGCTVCAQSPLIPPDRHAEGRSPVQVITAGQQDENGLRFTIKNNAAALQGTLTVNPGTQPFRAFLSLPRKMVSPLIQVPAAYLITGSNRVHFQWGDRSIDTLLVNWHLHTTGVAFEKIDLSSLFNDRVTHIFASPVIDDEGLRKLAANGNEILLPQGIPFSVAADTFRNNALFTSRGKNYPDTAIIELSGRSTHMYLLMAGTAIPAQNSTLHGEVCIRYTDSTADTLQLNSLRNWPSIEQDDQVSFTTDAPSSLRIYLKNGEIKIAQRTSSGIKQTSPVLIDGGAATVLDLPLHATKELQSFSLRTIADNTVIGLMGITLARN